MNEFLITFISLVTGYIIGRISKPEEAIQEGISKIYTKAQGLLPKSDLKPGIIKRPTSQQLLKKKEDPIEKASKEAMMKTLDNIPELQKAKEALKNGAIVLE